MSKTIGGVAGIVRIIFVDGEGWAALGHPKGEQFEGCEDLFIHLAGLPYDDDIDMWSYDE